MLKYWKIYIFNPNCIALELQKNASVLCCDPNLHENNMVCIILHMLIHLDPDRKDNISIYMNIMNIIICQMNKERCSCLQIMVN